MMRQEQEQRTTLGARLDALLDVALRLLQWVRTRGVELVEFFVVAITCGMALSMLNPGLFEQNRSFDRLADISEAIQHFLHVGGADEGPWATLLWALLLCYALAWAINLRGVVRALDSGEPDEAYREFTIARRLRVGLLVLLGVWWLFYTMLSWLSSPGGSGWRTYGLVAAMAIVALFRLTFEYGVAVLPFRRGGRRER